MAAKQDKELQEQFAKVIRRRRKRLGLGQEKTADIAGLHRTSLGLIERGKRSVTLQAIRKLAMALQTTMASLMEEVEKGLEKE